MIFEDEFDSKPHLMLQHLTYSDIRHYVDSRLQTNTAFKELHDLEPEISARLIENIVGKASGVFFGFFLSSDPSLKD